MVAPGFEPEDYEDDDDDVLLWPENEAVYGLFRLLDTQWIYASGGLSCMRVGLRYEAAYPLIDRRAKTDEEWQELFHGLRVMEHATLAECAALASSNTPK